MEHQKDTQQFNFPNKGQTQSKSNHQDAVSFLQRKAEKLTTALYMVTEVMSDKEPLKWKARESGVELLSDIAIAGTAPTSERMTTLRNVMKKIERVVSLLDIAQSARMMSEMNAGVLKKEYLTLKDSVQAEWNHVYDRSKSIFSESFFEVPREIESRVDTPTSPRPQVQIEVNTASQVAAPIKFSRETVEQKKNFPEAVQSTNIAKPFEHSRPVFIRPTPTLSTLVAGAGKARSEGDRDDRRKIILALIKQKPALTVKDIAKSIPGVSEKTIQRELLAMVAEGILIKKGERRWSTYSLREV